MTGPSWREIAAGPRIIGGYVPLSAEVVDDNPTMTYQTYGPGVSLRIDPDPLGPVNHILSVVYTDSLGSSRRLGPARLWPMREGSEMSLIQESPAYWMPSHWGEWVVRVDDRIVMRVPQHLIFPPRPPTPGPTVRQRIRRAVNERLRQLIDPVATRLSYVHSDDIGDDY